MGSSENSNLENKKILFVVSSTAQADMFAQISQHLNEWDVRAINIDKLHHKADMERALQSLNFSFSVISGSSQDYIDSLIEKEQPAVMVFGHDRNDLDKLFIRQANARGIPTLLVQDGVLAASRANHLESGSPGTSLKYWLKSPARACSFLSEKRSIMER